MGANKNGQRIMCSVICTPNRENPPAYVPAHLRQHLLSNPNIGVATVAAEAGHAQPSTTLAIYTQVYDRRRDEIRKQMSKELYE